MRNVFLVACLLCIMQQLSAQTNFTVTSSLSNSSARPAIGAGTIYGEIRGLSIDGSGRDDGFLRLSAGGGTAGTTKSFIDLSGYTYQVDDRYQNITIGTSGVERMRIDYKGYVGIGTLTPQAQLDVIGKVKANLLHLNSGSNYLGSLGQGLDITGGWSSTPDILSLTYYKRDFAIGGWHKTDGLWGGLALHINSDNGNVGIGASAGSDKLMVKGSVSVQESFYKVISSVGVSWQNTNLIGHGWYNNQDYTSIQVPGNNLNTAELRLFSNGNVAIGTPDAYGYKLAVNGSAIFTKAVVKNYANWPDYVFDSSYQLPSLESVSVFIKENKHLPEMPSASTIQKDGHDLGEVQKVLLKKVEEMTLYIIALKEQNERLMEENNRIQSRLEKVEMVQAAKP